MKVKSIKPALNDNWSCQIQTSLRLISVSLSNVLYDVSVVSRCTLYLYKILFTLIGLVNQFVVFLRVVSLYRFYCIKGPKCKYGMTGHPIFEAIIILVQNFHPTISDSV